LVVKVTIANMVLCSGVSSGGCRRSGAVAGGQLFTSGRYQYPKRMMSNTAKTAEILDRCNTYLGRNDLAIEGEL
jgi:hypothetical protein